MALALTCGCAATPPAVVPETAAAKPDATPPRLEVLVEGNAASISGKPLEGKELASELGRRRVFGANALPLRVVPGATDTAFADALEAAAKAGFEQVAIDHGGESLTVNVTNGSGPVRIIAWRSNDRLIAFDLKPAEGTSGLLGYFDSASDASMAALREKVTAACPQYPCMIELDLLPEARPTFWQTLSSWHRAVSAVPAASHRVLATVPRLSVPASAAPGSTPPKVRLGATTVSGRLPPPVIQQIVRNSFGNFRVCYEAGLGRKADLEGRVVARFVIGRDGKVSKVADGGSDMPDAEVVSCTLKAFSSVEFPPPANGIVTVVYPIMFAPG